MPLKAKSPKRSLPVSKGGRQKRAKKGGPKKALTAYMLFSMARREQIVKERPELRSNVTEMSKIIGAEWRQMTDEDKAPYQREHERAKERYLREKEEYDQHGTSSGAAGRGAPAVQTKKMENGDDDGEEEDEEEDDEEEEEDTTLLPKKENAADADSDEDGDTMTSTWDRGNLATSNNSSSNPGEDRLTESSGHDGITTHYSEEDDNDGQDEEEEQDDDVSQSDPEEED